MRENAPMKLIVSAALLGALTLLTSLPGVAEASDLARCASVQDDMQRLACYDLLAKEAEAHRALERPEEADDEAAERERIVSRCRDEMGAHGSAMVKFCVDEDMAAYRALQRYSAELRPLVKRCEREMGPYGWSMVKFCADEDIDAEHALNDMLAE